MSLLYDQFARDHFVDESVIFGFFRSHDVVAIVVFLDLLLCLPGVFRKQLNQQFFLAQNFFGLNFNV